MKPVRKEEMSTNGLVASADGAIIADVVQHKPSWASVCLSSFLIVELGILGQQA